MLNSNDNLIGKKFNNLTVLEYCENKNFLLCKCDCGNIKEIRKDHLLSGNTKGCGCLRKIKPFKLRRDLTGQKFEKLTVLSFAYMDNKHRSYYLCQCECGNKKVIKGQALLQGDAKSCGCSRYSNRIKHNLSNTRLYKIWNHMINRCYNPKDQAYKNYGKRGISVCAEWKNDVSSFYCWALANGYQDDLTIDRKDNNGNYSPENCHFVNYKIQSNNRRSNHSIKINNETHNLTEWAKIYNIHYSTIIQRLKRGWSEYDAVTTPLIK